MTLQNFLISYFRLKLHILGFFSAKKAGNKAFQLFCTPHTRTYGLEDSFKDAKQLSFKWNQLKIIGHRWNEDGKKKLLIVHGFRSASANFKHFVALLTNKGYQVLAFDAPAHGLSEGKTLNAVQYKNFIAALQEEFGPFDAFLCHSFGGLAVSLNLPELANNHLIKSVFIAPAANAEQLIEYFFKEMRIKNTKIQQHFKQNIYRLSGKNLGWFSIARCAPNIKGPVLWIHDEADNITLIDDALKIQQSQLPNFRFLFTRGLGHRRIYSNQEVVNAVISFL